MGRKKQGKRDRGTPLSLAEAGLTSELEGRAFSEDAGAGASAVAAAIVCSPTREAIALVRKIKYEIETGERGISASYPHTIQFGIRPLYTLAEIGQAKLLWNDEYSDCKAYVTSPQAKFSGDRDGEVQVNFIRLKDSHSKFRFNVHVRVKG